MRTNCKIFVLGKNTNLKNILNKIKKEDLILYQKT